MMTLPAIIMAAPNHHRPGRDSPKMRAPRKAVVMKFDEVLMMLTRTVEKARVRARVKRPHMMASKSRFSRKKKPRKANSKTLLSGERLNKDRSACDQLVVSDVVVLFATREYQWLCYSVLLSE